MSERRSPEHRFIPSTLRVGFDRLLLRVFPAIVVLLALLSLVLWAVFYRDDLSLRHLLYSICCSYATGFALIGLPSIMFPRRSLIPRSSVFLVFLGSATLLGVMLWMLFGDSEITPNRFITGFYHLISWSVSEISMYTVVMGTILLGFIVVLVTYGVLETLGAILCTGMHRMLLSMMRPEDGRLKRVARNLFMIPDVITVTDITIDPRTCDGFDRGLFARVSVYLIGLSLLFASYLFLNPVFLLSIPLHEMMIIMILLSLFVMAIVAPLFMVRTLGAEACSEGNRPLVLWKGLKNRVIRVGYCIGLFLTLLWVCLFIGVDILTILGQYAWFIAFMILASALVSFIFVNSFYPETKGRIVENFIEAKSRLG